MRRKVSLKYIAGSDVSVGCLVTFSGKKKRAYTGRLFKPWTWLRFEMLDVVVPTKTDHVAVIGRREFLKGAAALAGLAVLPRLTFATETDKPKTVLWDSGYTPAVGRMKIYSDMTFQRYSWLALGNVESGRIEEGNFIITDRRTSKLTGMEVFDV